MPVPGLCRDGDQNLYLTPRVGMKPKSPPLLKAVLTV